MNRKYLPMVLMLLAGAITCVITLVRHYEQLRALVVLFIVLLVFYLIGCAIVWMLNSFDAQNEKSSLHEGEVIEKEKPEDEPEEPEDDEESSAEPETAGDEDEQL